MWGDFLISSKPGSFSRRTLLNGVSVYGIFHLKPASLNGDSAYRRPVLSESFCIKRLHKGDWLLSVLVSYIDTSRGDSLTLGVISGITAVNEYQEK